MTEIRKERIAKVIARAGLCSRRESEDWIHAGRVMLNGHLLLTPAMTVAPEDHIVVDGKVLLGREKVRLWLYHKPRGLITTHKDPEGRPTIFQHLPQGLPRVVSVGRLDMNSEGLLLLTNSGDVARFFEHPKTRMARTYRVRVFGEVNAEMPRLLRKGLTIDGIVYGPVEATLEEQTERRKKEKANQWLRLTLYEGKNREIRNIVQYFGLSLNRLVRIGYGPFRLESLLPGDVLEVPAQRLEHELLKAGYT
ncbi:MAG: rRNA pseudouridine synthase [Caedimonas sp.]|nr:rRNA pseudouridine synthase [Caedimonas sp.]